MSPFASLQKAIVDSQSAGMRLDLFVICHLRDAMKSQGLSRSGIQKLIADGQITLNGKLAKSAARLRINDRVTFRILPPKKTSLTAEPIALNIIHEDDDCIVINKAPGIIVHPAAGKNVGTLVNAILHHCPNLQGIGGEFRPGIVHRLDKDTSGVMIVAKNAVAFQQLAQQFKDRRVKKEYLGLVFGKLKGECGIIDRPIGRHRSDRKRMSSVYCLSRKREAVTEWRVEKCFHKNKEGIDSSWVSLLRLTPWTGRTHQIRVHLADLGYPLIGDKIYGRKWSNTSGKSDDVSSLTSFSRQALHAERLGLFHPRTGAPVEFYAPLAADMDRLLKVLEAQDLDERVTKSVEGLTRKGVLLTIKLRN
jgi:23S rRNA pseudouridine1911/1915/1917 synthase